MKTVKCKWKNKICFKSHFWILKNNNLVSPKHAFYVLFFINKIEIGLKIICLHNKIYKYFCFYFFYIKIVIKHIKYYYNIKIR